MALTFANYVVTEACFGSDLDAEKFFDIKCRLGNLKHNCVIINAIIRSLKYKSYCPKEDLTKEGLIILEKIVYLKVHIENMKLYTSNIIVCLNRFYSDADNEVNYLKNYVENKGVDFEGSISHSDGSEGALNLTNKIINICNNILILSFYIKMKIL